MGHNLNLNCCKISKRFSWIEFCKAYSFKSWIFHLCSSSIKENASTHLNSKQEYWYFVLYRSIKWSMCSVVGSNAVYNNCLEELSNSIPERLPARFNILRSVENFSHPGSAKSRYGQRRPKVSEYKWRQTIPTFGTTKQRRWKRQLQVFGCRICSYRTSGKS